MTFHLRAIVLYIIKYKDGMALLHLYTNRLGRIVCTVKTHTVSRKQKRSIPFYPFALIDIEVQSFPHNEVYLLKEVSFSPPLIEILQNPIKSSLVFFLSEFLSKTLNDAAADEKLFHFLEESILVLEKKNKNVANFHLAFLTQLAPYLGIEPNWKIDFIPQTFLLAEGSFIAEKSHDQHQISGEEVDFFLKLLRMNYENMDLFHLTRKQRHRILNKIEEYYRLHLPDFPALKSKEILSALFA